MAEVKPFRAVRYDERDAGPLDAARRAAVRRHLAEEREQLPRREPVQRRPSDAAGLRGAGGARSGATGASDGVLARDEEPAFWWLAQDYVGPDGVERTRDGLVVALAVEPYESRVVLPHERTHAGPKEGRLRLLRATRRSSSRSSCSTRATRRPSCPTASPTSRAAATRLWRLDDGPVGALRRRAAPDRRRPPPLRDGARLPRGGRHRGERVVMVVLVPTRRAGADDLPDAPRRAVRQRRQRRAPIDEPRELSCRGVGRSTAAARYGSLEGDAARRRRRRPARARRASRTRRGADEAVAAVDRGEAEAAFLLRPPTIEQVRAVAAARRDDAAEEHLLLPKLPSGLLFYPL